MSLAASTFVTLLRHAWARHRLVLVIMALAVGIFEFVLTRVAPTPNEVGWIATMMAALPPTIRAIVGNDIALSPSGFLALGYAHPFFMILLSAWIVRVSAAAVAGEIGRGTMDLLASRPLPRWHLIAAGFTTIAAGLAIILSIGWIATAVGLWTRPTGARPSSFLPVILVAWLLFTAWGAVGLAIGATRRDGGQAIAWTTAILAASFVLDYLARLWSPIAPLRPFSLFRYYEPQSILSAGASPATVIVLIAVIAATLASTVITVSRRDF